MDSSIDASESLQLKALLSPDFTSSSRRDARSEKASEMNIEVEVLEIQESKV